MLAKFETKSSRVKGVSFHPTRPWFLCSLHDGQIQLWDYRVGTLLETFSEHDGPVRSVDFHPSQPLFVSGGDDYKIRVWNYNNKRSLFTLMGHLDYIRTVQFHPENPWIVSCSDDQNIRIWNWQSRECIAVLTGHNHYVMSAQFHPKEDLVVSASLDQTIRVWDISGLKQKGKNMVPKNTTASAVIGRLGTDLVGTVKYVLEGHERGVNWASFHPELPLIVSGSDDRMIKIWRTNEVKAWEVDTLRGHTNNVSCVMFHPREDIILSNSEDHSIRVWDSTKRVGIQSFTRAHDRFWIVTAHKTQNLLAAGHDSGTVVFKLRRERVPFACLENYCFYLKDRYYRARDLNSTNDYVLMPVTKGPASVNNAPRCLSVNKYYSEGFMFMMFNKEDNGSYEILFFNKNINNTKPSVISGTALSAAFISRNKFATLESSSLLFLRSFENSATKRISLPIPNCTAIFNGCAMNQVFLYNESSLFLFDTSSQQVLGTLVMEGVKRIVWNPTNTAFAVVTANTVYIVNRDLKIVASSTEKIRVKDALWEEHGILLYSTLSQIKYLLPSGEKGIVRSLDDPIYLVSYHNGTIFAFNRDSVLVKIEINSAEFLFKYYLEQKQYRNAIHIIRTCNLDSKAIIGYLQRSGYDDIALYFVSEPRARFTLAIRAGNLDTALECASVLDEAAIWNQLAEEALKQGNHEIVETCYQRTKSFDKLSFLYVITGNRVKLEKMLKIAELRKDHMSRFYNAMYLGKVESRIEVLLDVGQLTLAYITAVVYNKEEYIEKIKLMLNEQNIPIPTPEMPSTLITPPEPANTEQNWSLLEMPRFTVDRVMEEEAAVDTAPTAEEALERDFQSIDEEPEEKSGWGDDDIDMDEGENGWGDDLEFSDEEEVAQPVDDINDAIPKPGNSIISSWYENSPYVYAHVAAGDIDGACRLLHRQIGAIAYKPFISIMREAYLSLQTTSVSYPSMPALATPLMEDTPKGAAPASIYDFSHASKFFKMGLRYFQAGNFEESLNIFRTLLLIIPFVTVTSQEAEQSIKEYVEDIREYILAILLESKRKQCADNLAESLPYSYYMTRCRLQNPHLLLVLNSAMVAAFKLRNFIDSAAFGNRILSNPDANASNNAALVLKAKKVLARCEKEGRNAGESCLLDNRPFHIDAYTLSPIFKEDAYVVCPYCHANYKAENSGKLCMVCNVAQIGLETLGLVCYKPSKYHCLFEQKDKEK